TGGGGTGSSSSGTGGGSGGNAPVQSKCGTLTASDRGVSPTSIKVVFPWANLSTVQQAFAFTSSSEDDVTSIHTFVDDVNARGGVNCRKIDPEIVSYDPTSDSDMKAKCRQWTKDESVFAVIDTYAWHDDNQLCVAKDGNTPLISGWTTVGDQLRQGSPNLWWTGPEQIATLENLTSWAMSTGVLTKSTKFGIVYADRANDRLVKQQFASILARAGLTPKDTETMHYSAVDQSQAQAQGAVAVHNFQSQGVTVVFPLIPFTTFAVFLANAKSQSYKPRLLLSDFEQTVGGALGLLDAAQFDEQLDNQLGTTTMVLGNTDGPRGTAPNSPGYGPQEMSCY